MRFLRRKRGLAGFGLALVSILWAYDGWGDLSFMAGEGRDPERNNPRAPGLGTSARIALYLLGNAAYIKLIPLNRIPGSPPIAAAAPPLEPPAMRVVFHGLRVGPNSRVSVVPL